MAGKGVGFDLRADPVTKRTKTTEVKLTQKRHQGKVKVKQIQHHSILLNTTFLLSILKEVAKQI